MRLAPIAVVVAIVAVAPLTASAATAPLAARIGDEVGVAVGPAGYVGVAASAPVDVTAERRGSTVVVTVVPR